MGAIFLGVLTSSAMPTFLDAITLVMALLCSNVSTPLVIHTIALSSTFCGKIVLCFANRFRRHERGRFAGCSILRGAGGARGSGTKLPA